MDDWPEEKHVTQIGINILSAFKKLQKQYCKMIQML